METPHKLATPIQDGVVTKLERYGFHASGYHVDRDCDEPTLTVFMHKHVGRYSQLHVEVDSLGNANGEPLHIYLLSLKGRRFA